MKKRYFFTAAAAGLVFMANAVYSQAVPAETSIDLPDVSTIVSGGAPKAGKSAVPDYSAVLPDIENDEIVPRMPDAGVSEDTSSDSAGFSDGQQKTVYAEGVTGLGFPGFFTGNFSIYRQTGANPFKITFGHETVNGYAGHSLSSGYFDKNTHIEGEKTFSTKKTKLLLVGKYSSVDDGLQEKSANISDVTKEGMGASALFNINFTEGLSLESSAGMDWYKRYGNIVGNGSLAGVESFAEKISIIDLYPEINFSWETHGIYSTIGTAYVFSYDAGKVFAGHNSNRVDFSLLVGWKNEYVNIYGSADAVIGNKIGDNDVVVPFTAGTDFIFTTGLSSRNVRISAKGGIDSYLPKISVLEKTFKFSALNCMPEEISDWYGKLDVSLPVKDFLTVSLDGTFRKTAFGNGTWMPDYKAVLAAGGHGQYMFKTEELTQVNTDLGFSFRKGIATFSVNWRSFWGDVPAAEVPNQVECAVSLQDKKAVFVFDAGVAFNLGDGVDGVPVLDLDFTFKVSDAVRLAVTGNDVVKLISGKSRTYAGEYIKRSGSAGILAKFFF